MGREWLRVHIFSVQESAVYRYVFQRANQPGQRSIMQFHPCYAPHSGLYGLGIVGIHSIGRAEDMFYSKPIGQPDYGSQITGILHVIQRQTKGVGYNGSCLLYTSDAADD